MAANFLSGVSAGAHQGLADLVTSKRAERAAKRDQRRYENELMLRLGQVKSDRDYRNKMFAYQQARDKVGDEQWAQTHGLRLDMFEADTAHKEATLAETIRSNKAADEDRDADRRQRQEQFDANLAESIQSRTSRDKLTKLGILERVRQADEALAQRVRQADEALAQRKQEHIDSVKDQNLARKLQVQQQQTQADYYDELIRLREQELNQTQDPLEIQKIQAEIERIKAQTRYYDRQRTGSSRTSPSPTWGQAGDIAASLADGLIREYTDFGITPWTGTLPWTDPAGKNERGTQPEMLNKLGTQTFLNLMRRFGGDAALAERHLDSVFDAMLAHEEFGSDFRNDIIDEHPSPTLTDREKLEDARQMFLNAWRTGLANMLNNTDGTTGATDTGTQIRNMSVPKNQHDFRNRGLQ